MLCDHADLEICTAMPTAPRPLPAAVLTLALMAVISTLSLTPDTPQPGDDAFAWLVHVTPKPLQKLMHIASYGVLAVSLAWALARVGHAAVRGAAVFVIASGFGALMEWLQLFVPGRFASLYDIGLDAVGALIGLACAEWLARLGLAD
jgi:VanZ family protein